MEFIELFSIGDRQLAIDDLWSGSCMGVKYASAMHLRVRCTFTLLTRFNYSTYVLLLAMGIGGEADTRGAMNTSRSDIDEM
jgi:hypothetical protein